MGKGLRRLAVPDLDQKALALQGFRERHGRRSSTAGAARPDDPRMRTTAEEVG
jgi:hypothetical protein